MSSTRAVSKRILAINGSYRDSGMIDQALQAASARLRLEGAEVEEVRLRDYPIEFCTNCRQCTQRPGSAPGHCVLDDGMALLVAKIEAADALILAAPTNFKTLNALYKRFMERLVVYAYWPWGAPAPRLRKTGNAAKKVMLVSSSAAPSMLASWLFSSSRQLRLTAKIIGARPVGLLFCGLASQQRHAELSSSRLARAEALALKLLRE